MKAVLCVLALFGSTVIVTPALGEPPEAPARTEALGRRGDASVSLGVVGERRDVRHEVAAYVGVTVPLERFAGARPRLAADSVVSASERELDVQDGLDMPRRGADEDADTDGGGVVPALSAELFASLARDAVAAAENARHAATRERDLDAVGARARWSAVLPEVRIRAARSRDDSLHLQPTLDDPYRYTSIGGDGLLLEAQATFHLNRLLFADEEVALERLRVVRERVGEERAERVLGRLVRWHRALSRERGPGDAEERGRAALERVETEAELDVLTDGWFGEKVRHLGLDRENVERRAPPPAPAAAPKPASKNPLNEPRAALAGLEEPPASAKPGSPCLPKLATDSKTFCGALTR